ncbi:hypothetical protein [Rathayibacter sp. VKM Ac-2760]|uniref:hypothetical protein n=1 Tax=Rathayibacter sp. VKM Ac-2760 TaxID=2609253 RepID=UPI0013183E6C|nr:hypothetical protein [Rathayibacter sp. VKM Ac-2760]QHC61058.1 hypothetical protein GSU72_20235 [Rathayibacter sp. VKM Ac-2760]
MTTFADFAHDTVDPEFGAPFIDVDERRDAPLAHRYVHGGFSDSATRFSLYLPDAEQFEGRFFQYVQPVPVSEDLSQGATGPDDRISFAITSGAALVDTNNGGPAHEEPTYGAFRANAAVANLVRALLSTTYGTERVYGYAYGGSGGAFRVIAAAENTSGVWDGFVPFVVGSPMALPNVFSARLHGRRVLGDRLDDIVDAIDPGGSGDPAATLTDEQAEALAEVSAMGFPLRSWFAHRTMGMHAFAVIYPYLRVLDPSYFDDFWTVPGYLGADPTSSVHRDRLEMPTRIVELLSTSDLEESGLAVGTHPGSSNGGADDAWLGDERIETPVAARLQNAPGRSIDEAELVVTSGASAGRRIVVLRMIDDVAIFGPEEDESVPRGLRVGDTVTLDNSGMIAAQTYYRHQVPGRDFPQWDQFRGADGEPIHPQRPLLIGPLLALGATGTLQSGRFDDRMILVESVLDREAFPGQADWYAKKVYDQGGEQRFRIWMVDNALHGELEEQEFPTRTIGYVGVLHEALRQLAAWAERAIEPSASSSYDLTDGQVILKDARGVQPFVTLTADGSLRAEVEVGQEVTLEARVRAAAGAVVQLDWSDLGDGVYESEHLAPAPENTRTRTLTFTAPGTYFPAVRVIGRITSAELEPFGRLQNVARARVVVTGAATPR